MNPCPCGGGDYAKCCGIYHAGAAADSAERLMRSRYSAYVLGLSGYVYATWHASTRPALNELELDAGSKWLGLEVKQEVKQHEANSDGATVEFVARYKLDGRAHRLHEISRFVREGGQWSYLDGSFPERKTTT